jgi:hypothetical protein
MWGVLPPDVIQWATAQGWSRHSVQEGEEDNGLQFLAMHRVMIKKLVAAFPQHQGLFAGWPQPPSDPNDPDDPVPGQGATPLSPAMAAAVNRLQTGTTTFDGEDEFGRFIETSLRPFPNLPQRRSSDPSSGLHNYLHNRFADDASPINLGDPSVNIENTRFWKLHGWIDNRWSSYRAATGRSDTDPAYLKLLEQEAMHMEHGHGPMAARRAAPGRLAVPGDVRRKILRALSERVAPPTN